MILVKVIYSADMKESTPQMQAEITAAETRGESLLQIIYLLPQSEGGDIGTLLVFGTPQTEE